LCATIFFEAVLFCPLLMNTTFIHPMVLPCLPVPEMLSVLNYFQLEGSLVWLLFWSLLLHAGQIIQARVKHAYGIHHEYQCSIHSSQWCKPVAFIKGQRSFK
jgi:4-amino-4-deoxy-L-arabinose transferase-like glycosyltransferase